MIEGLQGTAFDLPGMSRLYVGKVRDVYFIGDKLVIVASDRISAFDHILPRSIPYKGQVLNGIAAAQLQAVQDIVPIWLESTPDPNVSIGKKCKPIALEMVIRGYLAGHAWRVYQAGGRELCGVALPDGLREGDRLPEPIITPATKAVTGHDEDISASEILDQGIVSQEDWDLLCTYTKAIFARGTEIAGRQGLLLVDTKYEFGYYNGEITLMDEIHTPDSSRYYIAEGYAERQQAGEKQKQLSKEFVREWLMSQGFMGKDGQSMPQMPDERVEHISERYQVLYNQLMGEPLQKRSYTDILTSIEQNILAVL